MIVFLFVLYFNSFYLKLDFFSWFLICFWNHVFMHLHLVLCSALFNMFLFVFSFVYFVFDIKIIFFEKFKNTKAVCFVYIGTCASWMAIEIKFSKLCISCSLDEHLYTQLSKWALWLMFVMSKIKWSLVFNTHITLFDKKN